MGMVVSLDVLMGMAVGCFILTVDVGMGMGMGMLMGMDQVAMTMFMGVNMGVRMDMLQGNGILHHQHRRSDHNDKTDVKLRAGPLPQQKHPEGHPQKGRDGIVGAGFGRPQILLGLDVEIDAQTIGHKSQHQNCQNPMKRRDLLPYRQRDNKAAQAGTDPLDGGDLNRAFGTEHPGAVVFQTPAAGRSQHQQRAGMKPKAARALKSQNDAGCRHQYDGGGQPPGQLLPKGKERDQGRGDNLKIVQQGGIGRIGALQTQHQQNRSGNVQHDHTERIGQLLPGQALPLFPLSPQQAAKEQAQSRAQIQKRRHHGRLHAGKQQLGKRDVDGVQRRCRNGKQGCDIFCFHFNFSKFIQNLPIFLQRNHIPPGGIYPIS